MLQNTKIYLAVTRLMTELNNSLLDNQHIHYEAVIRRKLHCVMPSPPLINLMSHTNYYNAKRNTE